MPPMFIQGFRILALQIVYTWLISNSGRFQFGSIRSIENISRQPNQKHPRSRNDTAQVKKKLVIDVCDGSGNTNVTLLISIAVWKSNGVAAGAHHPFFLYADCAMKCELPFGAELD